MQNQSSAIIEDVKVEPVASYWHSLGFLGILAATIIAGFAAQHRQVAGGGLVESRANVIPIYMAVAVMDWLLLFFAWRGIRHRGGSFGSIIGGRWATGREVLRDLGIAAIFWGIVFGAAWVIHGWLGEGHEKSLDILLPRSPLEVMAWIAASASAGFCEEYVFRGYVQRQLLALSQSAWTAVVAQGLIFGAMHAYQGWRPVLVICFIGILYGALAAWRKTLKVGMVAHGWSDIWSGWLGLVALR